MPDHTADPERALDAGILNHALEMASDLYASGIESVPYRLRWHYPDLSEPELAAYDGACGSATDLANGRLREFWHWDMTVGEEEEARAAWEAVLLERHPWISPRNLRRLWGNACSSWR